MNKGLSVYLDLLRFTAALTVFASHMTFPQFSGGTVAYQSEWAAAGVTAFFVLSGYVICYVSSEKEKTFATFAVSRLARIYSVALPALVLTIIVDLISMHNGWPYKVPTYQYAKFPEYLISALTFTNQAGLFHEQTFGNAPFWSLDYEVWYYILFAAATYYSGVRRAILVPVLMVAAGPRAILYMPMWLVGAGLYKLHSRMAISRPVALWGFLASVVALVALRISAMDTAANESANFILQGWPKRVLSNSQNFIGDYEGGSCVAANIFFAGYLNFSYLTRARVAAAISYAASFTFALYLMHWPLMNLFRYSFPYNPSSPGSIGLLVAAVLVTVWLLGFVTERRKKWWRAVFGGLIDGMRSMMSTRFPAVYRIVAP